MSSAMMDYRNYNGKSRDRTKSQYNPIWVILFFQMYCGRQKA